MTTPITTTTQLEALPVGSVILEGADGRPADHGPFPATMPGVFHRFPDGWYVVAGHGARDDINLPATVLHAPGQSPDPSPTVLALAQALATRDGHGRAFTSTTKSESSARVVNWCIGKAERIAAHLPAPTVKPGRDEVRAAVQSARWPDGGYVEHVTKRTSDFIADAVLAILPGKTEQEVRAEALRDAARAVAVDENDSSDWWDSKHRAYTTPAEWLRNRADEEAGK